MGWSCSMEASKTLEAIQDYARRNEANYSNELPGGFFWELTRREHDDGSVTGSVFDPLGYRRGPFKIEGDGTIVRFYGLDKTDRERILKIRQEKL